MQNSAKRKYFDKSNLTNKNDCYFIWFHDFVKITVYFPSLDTANKIMHIIFHSIRFKLPAILKIHCSQLKCWMYWIHSIDAPSMISMWMHIHKESCTKLSQLLTAHQYELNVELRITLYQQMNIMKNDSTSFHTIAISNDKHLMSIYTLQSPIRSKIMSKPFS